MWLESYGKFFSAEKPIAGSILSTTLLLLYRPSWRECFLSLLARCSLYTSAGPASYREVSYQSSSLDVSRFCCCIIDIENTICPHWTLSLSHHLELGDLAQLLLLDYTCYTCMAATSSTSHRTGHNIERIPQILCRSWGWFQRLKSGAVDADMCNIRAVVRDLCDRLNMHLRTCPVAELWQSSSGLWAPLV